MLDWIAMTINGVNQAVRKMSTPFGLSGSVTGRQRLYQHAPRLLFPGQSTSRERQVFLEPIVKHVERGHAFDDGMGTYFRVESLSNRLPSRAISLLIGSLVLLPRLPLPPDAQTLRSRLARNVVNRLLPKEAFQHRVGLDVLLTFCPFLQRC